jgi:hypothetical protein
MLTNTLILAHKDKQVLENIIKKLSGFCVSMEYMSDRMLLIDTYLDKDEIETFYKTKDLSVFNVDKEVMELDTVLDKISATGVDSLLNSETFFLKTVFTSSET